MLARSEVGWVGHVALGEAEQLAFYGSAFFLSPCAWPICDHSLTYARMVLFQIGSEIFFSDTDFKKTIQKPLGLCELLKSMELKNFP